jgi:hypothetical protein
MLNASARRTSLRDGLGSFSISFNMGFPLFCENEMCQAVGMFPPDSEDLKGSLALNHTSLLADKIQEAYDQQSRNKAQESLFRACQVLCIHYRCHYDWDESQYEYDLKHNHRDISRSSGTLHDIHELPTAYSIYKDYGKNRGEITSAIYISDKDDLPFADELPLSSRCRILRG